MNLNTHDVLWVLGTTGLALTALWFALAWRTPAVFLGFFLWIHIEDLVRIILGNQPLVFFVKTVLFAAMLAGFAYTQFARRARFWKGFPVLVPLLLFLGFACVQSLNPALQHPLQPLIGLHAQFMYIPVFLLAYHYFDREQRVRQFLLFTFVLAAAESILTIPQMVLGPQWWYSLVGKPDTLELFVGRTGAAAGEDFFRPSSIFANAGRFIQYLSVVATMLVGALFYFPRSRQRTLAYVCFACVFAGIYITSGRTTMYLLVMTVAIFLLLGYARQQRRLQVTLAATAAIFVILWTLPSVLGDTSVFIQNLFLRPLTSLDTARGSGSLLERLLGYGESLSRAWNEGGWTGHGTGSNSLGLYFIQLATEGEEPGYAALLWEYGVLGLVLWLALMGLLWWRSFRVYRNLRESRLKPLALAALLLVNFAFIYQYIGYQILQNYLVTIHFWTFVALLFALPKLQSSATDVRENWQRLPSSMNLEPAIP